MGLLKAQNGQDRDIAHPLTENHMKGTSFLEGWHNLLHKVTCPITGYVVYIHTMNGLSGIKLERVGPHSLSILSLWPVMHRNRFTEMCISFPKKVCRFHQIHMRHLHLNQQIHPYTLYVYIHFRVSTASNSLIGGWGMAVTVIIWLINEWVRVFPKSREEEIVPFPSIMREEPHSLQHVPQDGYQCCTSVPTNPVTSVFCGIQAVLSKCSVIWGPIPFWWWKELSLDQVPTQT